jgi:hypothetical protein
VSERHALLSSKWSTELLALFLQLDLFQNYFLNEQPQNSKYSNERLRIYS